MSNQPNSGTNGAENADFHDESLQGNENVDTFAEGKPLYIDPLSDYGFKKIFSQENVMKSFLNDLLQLKSPIKNIKFLDKEMQSEIKGRKLSVYDLRCKSEDGSEFIVEMQKESQAYFSERIIYYLSRSISTQRLKGKKSTEDRIFNLKPVYGVFLLNFSLNGLKKKMIRTVQLMVKETREGFSDKVKAYILELPCIKNTKPEECKTNIERWIYNLYNMGTTTKPLKFQDVMPVFTEVASAAEIAKMSEDEFRRYQDMIDSIDTEFAVEQYKMETKYNEGKAEGLAEGKVEGRIKERLKNAKAMKAKGYAAEDIAEITGLSVAEIKKL